MRIRFGAILLRYLGREFNSDEFSARLQLLTTLTGFARFWCGRNLVLNLTDSTEIETALKSAKIIRRSSSFKGSVPTKTQGNIQLTEYLPHLFDLSHFSEGSIP